jgi:hypothetical protein
VVDVALVDEARQRVRAVQRHQRFHLVEVVTPEGPARDAVFTIAAPGASMSSMPSRNRRNPRKLTLSTSSAQPSRGGTPALLMSASWGPRAAASAAVIEAGSPRSVSTQVSISPAGWVMSKAVTS